MESEGRALQSTMNCHHFVTHFVTDDKPVTVTCHHAP
jgi:putative intracellular protease/amidase